MLPTLAYLVPDNGQARLEVVESFDVLAAFNELIFQELCSSDKVPREFTQPEQQGLEELAAIISRTIEVRRSYLQRAGGTQQWLAVQKVAAAGNTLFGGPGLLPNGAERTRYSCARCQT